MKIPAKVPCGGSVMRVAFDQQGADGIYAHEDMEVYAMGFRNQSGVAFGPAGSRFENALAVSDNGANDLGNRRVANGAEKIWLVTEMGQDAGFPDKEGFLFVSGKRYGWDAYRGNPIDRPYPNLYIGEEPFVPKVWPYRFQHHVEGVRGVPHIDRQPQSGRLHQPDPGVGHQQPDRRHRLERLGLRQGQPPVRRGLRHPGHRAGEPRCRPGRRSCDVEFLEPSGVKWSYFARNIEMGPNAYQQEENRGGLERPNDVVFSNDGKTMYIVDYGEVFTDFEMPSPFYTVPKSGVIWTVTRQGRAGSRLHGSGSASAARRRRRTRASREGRSMSKTPSAARAAATAGSTRQLPEAAAAWLREQLGKLAGEVRDRDLYVALGLVPRKLGKADLALSEADLAEAARARPGWDPRGWSVDQAARIRDPAASRRHGRGFAARFVQLCRTADVAERSRSTAACRSIPTRSGSRPRRPRARAPTCARCSRRWRTATPTPRSSSPRTAGTTWC